MHPSGRKCSGLKTLSCLETTSVSPTLSYWFKELFESKFFLHLLILSFHYFIISSFSVASVFHLFIILLDLGFSSFHHFIIWVTSVFHHFIISSFCSPRFFIISSFWPISSFGKLRTIREPEQHFKNYWCSWWKFYETKGDFKVRRFYSCTRN